MDTECNMREQSASSKGALIKLNIKVKTKKRKRKKEKKIWMMKERWGT